MTTSRLFVGSLSYISTIDTLRAAAEKYGAVEKVAIPRLANGRSRGFAFIECVTVEDARRIAEGLNDSSLDGITIRCVAALPRTGTPAPERERCTWTKSVEAE